MRMFFKELFDWFWELPLPLILTVIVVIMVVVGAIIGEISDSINWNDGKCKCGGDWEYTQVVGHAYSTNYLYMCDDCGKTHEFSMKMD